MARTYAAQGIGKFNRTTAVNSPDAWKRFPYVVIIGASGQIGQLLPPSGFGSTGSPSNTAVGDFHAYEANLSHSNIAWKRNRIVTMWASTIDTAGTMMPYAWSPEPQEARKVNPNTDVSFETNVNIKNWVIADGHNWELWNYQLNTRDFAAMFPIHEAVVWRKRHNSDKDHFGFYKGDEAHDLSATDPGFWINAHGAMGAFGRIGNGGYAFLPGGNSTGGRELFMAGINWAIGISNYPTNMNFNACEMINHRDTFYCATQHTVIGFTVGCKGNFVHSDFGVDDDTAIGSLTGYQSRDTTAALGARPRSLTVHNDKVWMLDNEGKVFEVRPGGVIERATLSTVGTRWASGIFGGQMNQGINPYTGAQAFRPLLRSFNQQLHAFLNFRTSDNVATGKDNGAGIGHGIAWFTSHDGSNWSDRSEMLPASGIQTPSGNAQPLGNWLAEISPYTHTARQSTNYPSGYGAGTPDTNPWSESAPEDQGDLGQPSGFTQRDEIPFLYNINDLDDTPGTTFDNLVIPLTNTELSGYLFPTSVNYPSGYAFVDEEGTNNVTAPIKLPEASGAVWRAIGQGSKGYDYTGCSNYHIAGHVDEDDTNNRVLRLYFSRDFVESGEVVQPTLFFDLTTSSGFIQKNEAWSVNQLNGYVPIELFDPEVIVPSGDFREPNPLVNSTEGTARIKFTTIDYGFWQPVNVKVQYTLNGGITWADAETSGTISNLSTGTSVTDPSGMGISAAQQHEVFWLYKNDLNKNTFYPRANIRIRAERV